MSHLTASQRYAISVMRQSNYTQKAIALAIGKDKSVISRELKRNSDGRTGEYKSDLAERKCRERHKRKRKSSKFTAPMQDRVETLLREDYSPEQVVGFLKQEGTACVSHERIYQHIWADKKRGGNLYKHLRTKGKRYRKRGAAKDKRGTICNKVSIEERPDIVEEKSRFGDLEIDTVIGKNHQGAIVTINDRATGMLKMKKIPKKEAALVKEAALELLQEWKPLIHTITSDNGKEFALHQDIAKELGIQFYFAHPYHSWERGANENLNGLIRQYIPKKTNFADISDQFIADIQDKLNNRPRKRLNFKSPNQTFTKVAFIT
jgi:IS30 family transposase